MNRTEGTLIVVLILLMIYNYWYLVKSNFVSEQAVKLYDVATKPHVKFSDMKKMGADPIVYTDVMRMKAAGTLSPENIQRTL